MNSLAQKVRADPSLVSVAKQNGRSWKPLIDSPKLNLDYSLRNHGLWKLPVEPSSWIY